MQFTTQRLNISTLLNNLTTKEYWVADPGYYKFSRHENHEIDQFIKKYIPPNDQGSCIEIGSFPGPHLTTFGDLGYTLNGLDFHPLNEKKLPEWLISHGYKTGDFVSMDFFRFSPGKSFDVVASFGFIEHFQNYKEVILKHAGLVNEHGYLMITTPNFRGWIQQWLHNTFDKNNLALHNLDSMRPDAWATILQDAGFEIIYKGYFGGFSFWRDPEKMSTLKRKAIWVIERIITRLRKILWFQSGAFSAYCGIVAKKR